MLLTFGLLGAAMVAVWLPDLPDGPARWQPWIALFAASVAAGVAAGLLQWPALVLIAAMWAAAWASVHAKRPIASAGWTALAALVALALATHRMPGFSAALVAEQVRLSADSATMTLVANFDKGAAGLILLVYFCRRIRNAAEWPAVAGIGVGIGAATAAVVIPLVASTGAVRFDPKLPAVAPAWLASNLFLTSLMEEAFFRGLLQERMARALASRARWRYLPIVVPSLLFGLVHFVGGPLLVAFAALAGVGYGMAYAMTGRVEAAVLAHFTLNSIHFFGFTYPYAVR